VHTIAVVSISGTKRLPSTLLEALPSTTTNTTTNLDKPLHDLCFLSVLFDRPVLLRYLAAFL